MLRVATVLSAREWEARLVAAARDSAAVRLVLRAYLPDEVTKQADAIDVVVAGSETPWVTPTRIAAWRRLGLRVVGVHPRSDRPAAGRFSAGGADLVLDEDLDPDQIVREIRLLDPRDSGQKAPRHPVVAVTGVRGGPGRTEIATAAAWAAAGRGSTALVDADLAAPSIAVRLGLPPRPDLADCIDSVLDGGSAIDSMTQAVGRLLVVPGALRPAGIRSEAAIDVVDALAATSSVVVDAGPWDESAALLHTADVVLFVVDANAIGIVRAARIVETWDGDPPTLILNKVNRRRATDVVTALRRWTGLEPQAVIPFRMAIRRAAGRGAAPRRVLVKALHGVLPADSS